MKSIKIKKLFIIISSIIICGVASFLLSQFFIPTASGDDNTHQSNFTEILNVELNQDSYALNEPLNVEGSKIYLKLENGGETIVELKEEYVKGFQTKSIGVFELEIEYSGFTFSTYYSVNYKAITMAKTDYNFSFELNESFDKSDYFVYCLDYFDNIAKVITLEDCLLENFSTSSITSSYRTAYVYFNGLETKFDYEVFYFASSSNYVGISEIVGENIYEILEFMPSKDGYITILKRITTNNLIEGVYTFNLKRVDSLDSSTFLTNVPIVKFNYDDHVLTIQSGVVGNDEEILISMSKGEKKESAEPIISGIVGVENLKRSYILNEPLNFENAKIVVKLTDGQLAEVDLNEDNIKNLFVDKVGGFTALIKYYSFTYYFDYDVLFKSISFYSTNEENDLDNCFEFNLNDEKALESFSIICFDYYNNIVGFRNLLDEDVTISGFDVSYPTGENKIKVACVTCYGAKLYFEYSVN